MAGGRWQVAGDRWQVAPPEEPVCHQPVVEELELEGVGLAPSGQVVVELGWGWRSLG